MLGLEHVTAGYGASMVLRDVTVTVPDHSVVAILGPNGAGKTTLLRVASGLLQPGSGRITLDGHALRGRRTHEIAAAGVCHVPEGRGIFQPLTVKENLRLQARPGDDDPIDRAAQAFPTLAHRLNQVAGTLSGGEQQMLALAHAYLSGARVILLDEVSMGLAPKIVDEIFVFLRLLAEQGGSLVIVEQYVHRALELADYVYILNRGRVVFAGEPVEVNDTDELAASYLG